MFSKIISSHDALYPMIILLSIFEFSKILSKISIIVYTYSHLYIGEDSYITSRITQSIKVEIFFC